MAWIALDYLGHIICFLGRSKQMKDIHDKLGEEPSFVMAHARVFSKTDPLLAGLIPMGDLIDIPRIITR